jgi:Trk K+ transport system NAD-binding subunit
MLSRYEGPNPLRLYFRFVRYLVWEFRWPLCVFATLVLSGGLALRFGYHREHLSFLRACHAVFMLIFLESALDFPDEWYLQPLFFLMPIVGLGAVADSVVRLAYLMFTRKQNLQEWQRMVASLYRNHYVVVGVGKVGYQIIKGLLELREPVVAIELESKTTPLMEELLDRGVPIIQGNGRTLKTLEQAGTREADAVILATSDDLANLDAALTARDLNPGVRIVLRLFDETLASKVEGAFAMPAISTSQVAAPAFIAAATGRKVYQPFTLSGKMVHMTDLTIDPHGELIGVTVGDLQKDNQVNVVMHQGAEGVNVNPGPTIPMAPGDVILVIAQMEQLVALEVRNRPNHHHGHNHQKPAVASSRTAFAEDVTERTGS